MKTLQIKIVGGEKKMIERLLCSAHQGDKESVLFFFGMIALDRGWDVDKLFYYLKEARIK